MKHHETMSPSSWGRVDRCPGSAALTMRVPTRQMHSPGAERGTIIHAAALEGQGLEELNEFDRSAVDKYRAFVSETMRKYAEDEEWKAVEGLESSYQSDYFPAGVAPAGWAIHLEETLLIWGKKEMLSFGTADEIWVPVQQDAAIHIFDLKTHPTGEIPEHSTTCQGIAYAIGALQRWRSAPAVVFSAFAPYGSKEGTAYSFTVSREELVEYERWAGNLQSRVQRAINAEPDRLLSQFLTPGDEQCKFCRAAGVCPAIREVGREVQRELVQREGLPPGMVRADNDRLEVQDEEALAEFYYKMELAQKALDGAKTDLKRLLGETSSEFLELRERGGRRSFIVQPRAKSHLPPKVARVLRKEDFIEATTISISKLRAVFATRYVEEKGCTKAEAGVVFDDVMAETIGRGDPSHSIAWRKGAKKLLIEKPHD